MIKFFFSLCLPAYFYYFVFITPSFAQQVALDPYIDQIRSEPAQEYEKLIRRKKNEGPNFSFPELKVSVANVIVEIEDTLKVSTLKLNDIIVLNDLLSKFRSIQSAGVYPYLDTLKLIYKEIQILDFLDYLQKYCSAFRKVNLSDGSGDVLARSKIFPNDHFYQIYNCNLSTSDLYQLPIEPTGNLFYEDDTVYGETEKNGFLNLLYSDYTVIFPSYNPVDYDYFIKVGHVPFFIAGMVPAFEELFADGSLQRKMRFFIHDIQCHGVTLFTGLLKGLGFNVSGKMVLDSVNFKTLDIEQVVPKIYAWNQEARTILQFAHFYKERDPNFFKILEIFLFYLYHDNQSKSLFLFNTVTFSYLEEQRERLEVDIRNHYYGNLFQIGLKPEVRDRLYEAVLWVYLLSQHLKSDPRLSLDQFGSQVFPLYKKENSILFEIGKNWKDFAYRLGMDEGEINSYRHGLNFYEQQRRFQDNLNRLKGMVEITEVGEQLPDDWLIKKGSGTWEYKSRHSRVQLLHALRRRYNAVFAAFKERIPSFYSAVCVEKPEVCLKEIEEKGLLPEFFAVFSECKKVQKPMSISQNKLPFDHNKKSYVMSAWNKKVLIYRFEEYGAWQKLGSRLEIPLEERYAFKSSSDLFDWFERNYDDKVVERLNTILEAIEDQF